MNKKTILLLVVAVLCIVAVIGYPVAKNYMIAKDPINHIMYSAIKTGEEKNVSASVAVKTELDEELAVKQGIFDYASQSPRDMAKFVNALLKKLEINYGVNVVTDAADSVFKMDVDMGMNYSGKSLISGKINMKPWVVGLEFPELYQKPFYFNINAALQKEGLQFNLEDLDLKAYLDLLQKEDDLYKAVEKNYEPYKKVVYDYLEGKVTKLEPNTIALNINGQEKDIAVTKYQLDVNILEIYDLYGQLLEIAKDDEAVKALVVSRVKEFKDLVVKNKDYEKAGLTEAEFTEGMEKIEEQINNDWSKGIDAVIAQIKSIPTMPEMAALKDLEPKYIVSIDKNFLIRQVEFGMQTEFIKMNEVISYNAFGQDVQVNTAEKDENGINLLSLEQNPALTQELGQTVVNNLSTKLFGGEAVAALISDIKTESKVLPAAESEQIINSVDMMMEQVQMNLEFMLQGMGL